MKIYTLKLTMNSYFSYPSNILDSIGLKWLINKICIILEDYKIKDKVNLTNSYNQSRIKSIKTEKPVCI